MLIEHLFNVLFQLHQFASNRDLFFFLCFREEIEKQKAHERYMRLQEQGKTDQAKKDLGDV